MLSLRNKSRDPNLLNPLVKDKPSGRKGAQKLYQKKKANGGFSRDQKEKLGTMILKS